ncbi:unnamed protein product, partial [Amoebophrya sp. A25]
ALDSGALGLSGPLYSIELGGGLPKDLPTSDRGRSKQTPGTAGQPSSRRAQTSSTKRAQSEALRPQIRYNKDGAPRKLTAAQRNKIRRNFLE